MSADPGVGSNNTSTLRHCDFSTYFATGDHRYFDFSTPITADGRYYSNCGTCSNTAGNYSCNFNTFPDTYRCTNPNTCSDRSAYGYRHPQLRWTPKNRQLAKRESGS